MMKNSCFQSVVRSIHSQANAQVRLLRSKGYCWEEEVRSCSEKCFKVAIRTAIYRLMFQQVMRRHSRTVVVKLLCIPGPTEEPVLLKFYYSVVSSSGRIRLKQLEAKSHYGNRMIEINSKEDLPTCRQIFNLMITPVWISSAIGEDVPYYQNGMRLLTG